MHTRIVPVITTHDGTTEAEHWTDAFKADVRTFFGIHPAADVLHVDPNAQVYDPDEPCQTCKMSWFAVEVTFRLPNGCVISETHRGDTAEFLTAVSNNSQA